MIIIRKMKHAFSIAMVLVLFGCEEDKVEPTTPAPPAEAVESTDKPSNEAKAEPSKPAGSDPFAQLAAMDTRKPVPLQPMMAWHQKQNMMEHLVAIQRITAGASKKDWGEIQDAAKLIESSPQMQQMCQHMGAGAEGFTDMALEFHKRADAIAPAAKEKDLEGVLAATAHTLQACTSCHAAFRQVVVDAATWQERTGSAHQPGQMHHHGGH
jgi:hypothetical protein